MLLGIDPNNHRIGHNVYLNKVTHPCKSANSQANNDDDEDASGDPLLDSTSTSGPESITSCTLPDLNLAIDLTIGLPWSL